LYDIIVSEKELYLVACKATFSGGWDTMLSIELLKELNEYVDSHICILEAMVCEDAVFSRSYTHDSARQYDISDFVKKNKKPSFCKLLLSYIDKTGIADSEVYKKAGIDRRHFSKIRSNPDYHPGKYTAISLALALELEKKETVKLIGSAGYTLSESETFDLVISFCLEHGIYALDDVNQALDYFSLKPLSGVSE
jgi:tRNA(Glu) U13 pseudouridine synthase TruD